ncbi:MAG: 30S ribosomal protein S21 [Saprospiraceae bacterium]|nr:30S ribosomal protein S21 [Saprospiraceae bacterium]
MLIIERKDEESIERALKRYKRKFRNTKLLQELRKRKHFTKPSIERRKEIINAEYKLKKQQEAEQ